MTMTMTKIWHIKEKRFLVFVSSSEYDRYVEEATDEYSTGKTIIWEHAFNYNRGIEDYINRICHTSTWELEYFAHDKRKDFKIIYD